MMTDMTKNRVPYGLMTEAEKKALQTAEREGEQIQFWTKSYEKWKETDVPAWCPDEVYRVKPSPASEEHDCRDWVLLIDRFALPSRIASGERADITVTKEGDRLVSVVIEPKEEE